MTDIFARRRGVSISALAIALGAAAVAQPAFAQSADATPDPAQAATEQPGDAAPANEIVVTGFRGSIRSAIAAKRNATQIIESLSAEDVGKLPDVSITDALARLPGVTAQQNAGRATYLSIRGFGPDFTTATLNGRVIATIDDNRRFQYDQFPGDLFSRIDVIKTPSADLMNQGLAGTVNLMTIDPLTSKPTLAVNVQGEINGKHAVNPDGDNKGYKGSVIWTDRFANDTIGISLAGSAISSPVQTQGYATWGYNGANQIGGAKWYVATNELKRQSGFGHLIWRPSDKFETSIDGLYTHSTTHEYMRGVEVPLAYGGGVAMPSATYDASGWPTSMTFNPTWPVQRNNFNTRDADTWAIGWNAKASLSDTVRFVADASYSRAHRHDNAIETYTGTSYNRTGQSQVSTLTSQSNGTYALDTNLDYTNLANMVFTDPQGWGNYAAPAGTPHAGAVPQAGYINEPDFTDTVKTFRGAFQGDINAGVLKSWEVGGYYSDEKKVNAFTGYYLIPPDGANTLAIPSSIVIGTVSPYGLSGSKVIAYDVNSAVALLDSFRNEQPSETTKQWWVRERILTGYAQLNFDGDVSGHRITGNLGAQFIHTVQDGFGYASIDPLTVVPVYARTSYNYFLPQATFNLEFTRSFILRMGAGRTLARARLSDENPSYTVSAVSSPTDQGHIYDNRFAPLSGTGGNPLLRPYFSNYVDISLEKYFANNQGKIALAGYYKDITNFVQSNKSYSADFSAFASQIPDNVATDYPNYTTMGWVTSSANTGRGYVQGFELSAALPFSIAASWLDGFGLTGSVAYADSAIRFDNSDAVTLPGLSKWVAQAQLYFEKWGFNARASYNYRSDYLGEYQGYGAQPSFKTTKGGSTLDAQIGYDVKSGTLNGLSLYVQARNLTNMPFVTYLNNDKRQIDIYEKYGPTYMAGITFKFW